MKPNPDKVDSALARSAVENSKDRGSVYSQCVLLSFRTSGKLDCGFDNKDLQAWIDKNMPDYFDK